MKKIMCCIWNTLMSWKPVRIFKSVNELSSKKWSFLGNDELVAQALNNFTFSSLQKEFPSLGSIVDLSQSKQYNRHLLRMEITSQFMHHFILCLYAYPVRTFVFVYQVLSLCGLRSDLQTSDRKQVWFEKCPQTTIGFFLPSSWPSLSLWWLFPVFERF